MAITVINDRNRPTNLGASIGAGIGQGLQSTIGSLALNRLGQLTQQAEEQRLRSQQAQAFQGLGLNKQQAGQFAALPEQIRFPYLNAFLAQQAQQQQQQPNAIESLAQFAQQQQQQQQARPQPQMAQQGQQRPQNAGDLLTSPFISETIRNALGKSQIPQQMQQPQQAQIMQPEQGGPRVPQVAPQLPTEAPLTLPKTQAAAQAPLATPLAQAPATLGGAIGVGLRKEQIAGNKEELKAEIKQRQEASKEYRDLKKEATTAKQSDTRLDRMEELINSGKLNHPLYVSLLKAAGKGYGAIDLSGLLSKETREFDKLSADFIRDAKSIFGNRITDTDLTLFMNTIPQSTDSDDAKRSVIRNMRTLNQGKQAKEQIADQIVQENNGQVPTNINKLVQDRFAPIQEQLAENFRSGTAAALPKVGQKLSKLPNASAYAEGTEITDKRSGQVYRKSGSQWVKRR